MLVLLKNFVYKHFGVQVGVVDCQNVFVGVYELSFILFWIRKIGC